MPSGISINGVFLPRVSLGSLDSKLEECTEDIRSLEQQLIALAAQPPTINADGEGNPIPWHEWVVGELNQILSDYKDGIVTQYLVKQVKDALVFAPDDVHDDHYDDGGERWKILHGFKKDLAPKIEGWERAYGIMQEGDAFWSAARGELVPIVDIDVGRMNDYDILMRKTKAKPGPALLTTEYTIPDGWERVTEGWAAWDTMIWENGQWVQTPAMGNPVEMYACVIRKIEAKPGPALPEQENS